MRLVLPRYIPVHLPSLASRLGVERARVAAAFRVLEERSLVELGGADRSSGTRLLRKGQLDVDFAQLRERRAHEMAKLDRMVELAEADQCRRWAILDYFGERPDWDRCGTCDVCKRGGAVARETTPLTGAAETVARKVLACTARMGNGHAAGMVVKVLTGSASKSITSWGFTKLSTYGLLREFTQDEAMEIVRALVRAGCLVETEVSRQVGGFERRYRVLNLSALGGRVMRQQEPGFVMHFPEVGPLARRASAARRASDQVRAEGPLSGGEGALFEKLREVRRVLAEDEGVPPFAMGSNRLLRSIAKERPLDRARMLECHGMGPKMFDKVGRHYLEVVAAFGP